MGSELYSFRLWAKTDVKGMMMGIKDYDFGKTEAICWHCSKTDRFRCSWFRYPPSMPEDTKYIVSRMNGQENDRMIITECDGFDLEIAETSLRDPEPGLFKGWELFWIPRKKTLPADKITPYFSKALERLLRTRGWRTGTAAEFFGLSRDNIVNIMMGDRRIVNHATWAAIATEINKEIKAQNPDLMAYELAEGSGYQRVTKNLPRDMMSFAKQYDSNRLAAQSLGISTGTFNEIISGKKKHIMNKTWNKIVRVLLENQ